jgi:hypothetical protein
MVKLEFLILLLTLGRFVYSNNIWNNWYQIMAKYLFLSYTWKYYNQNHKSYYISKYTKYIIQNLGTQQIFDYLNRCRKLWQMSRSTYNKMTCNIKLNSKIYGNSKDNDTD